MKEIIVVRHGQSYANIGETNHPDSEITQTGREQVQSTADWLAEHDLSDFQGITSPLHRALQTADIIHQKTKVPFMVDFGPREVMMIHNDFDIPLRSADFPHFHWPWKSEKATLKTEDERTYLERIASFVEGLPNGKYLIVSHGTPTRTIVELASGEGLRVDLHDYVRNASINWVRDGKMLHYNKVMWKGPLE
jgi:broad specificity phosphatase PhoE